MHLRYPGNLYQARVKSAEDEKLDRRIRRVKQDQRSLPSITRSGGEWVYMSIVRHAIQRHGGSTFFYSALGKLLKHNRCYGTLGVNRCWWGPPGLQVGRLVGARFQTK